MIFRTFIALLVVSVPLAVAGCTGSGVDVGRGDARSDASGEDGAAEDDGADEDTLFEDGGVEPDSTEIDTSAPDGATLVQIRMVEDGETVAGSVTLELAPVGRIERLVDYVTLKINGDTVLTDTKLPTRVVVDTTEWMTNRLELLAEAQDKFDAGSHAISLRTNNPQIRFTEVTPRTTSVKNGDVISVVVRIDAPNDVALTADFSALDSEFDAGQSYSFAIGGGEYAVTYVVSNANTRRDGNYTIPLNARLGPWDVQYTQFSLRLQNKAVIPVTITNGIFVNNTPPAANPAWPGSAPTVTSSNANIVTGGTSVISTTVNGQLPNTDVVGVIVSLDGHDGYYQVPVDRDNPPANGIVEAALRLRQYRDNELVPQRMHFRVALKDSRGRISPYQALTYNVIKVGGGDIQFTLSWDHAVDLDLYVVDPFNCEIYYGRRVCSESGGELDLDANAGCGGRPVQNENVFWPDGAAPAGRYTARVNYWSNCSESRDVSYTLTVNYCGRTEIYPGTLRSSQASGGSSGAGQVVATIDNRNCQLTAIGRIRYQDRVFNQAGFGAYRWKSVEGAFVELRELGTNVVLGTGVTDAKGDYLIPFSTSAAGYVVAVKTMTNEADGIRDIKLYDHPKFKRIYEVTSPPVVLVGYDEDTVVQDVDITVDRAAGAFNIFDVLRQSYDQVRLGTGRDLGELRGFWATGTDTTDTIYCSEFLYNSGVCTEVGSVSVQGKDTDRDEYDDMVIAREFFKFALNTLGRDSHPGDVADGRRDDARRSWTEGAATWFAADLFGSRYYVDSRPFATYVVDDLEDTQSPYAFRTENNFVSRYLVMSVLWDLTDSDNEDQDEIDRMRNAIQDVMFTHFSSDRMGDRGPEGVDLTDFLDGWLCRGWGMSDELSRLLDYYDYNYDFAGPSGCWMP